MAYKISAPTVPFDGSIWNYEDEGAGDLYFGIVQEETPVAVADLQEFAYYSTSDQTDVDDLGGAIFTLVVTIEKTTTTTAAMATFVAALFNLVNGDQIPANGYPFTYQSTLFGSRKMKIRRIDGLSLAPNQLIFRYTITFVESTEA